MKKILAVISMTFFIGIAIVSAQMGGMMHGGGMNHGVEPEDMGPGMMDGQWNGWNYDSNGEQIFFTGVNDAGERIRFNGGPGWFWMHGGGCASCHGVDGRGGFPVMMGTQISPNITYKTLTEGEHEHGEEEGEEHEIYTDELIKRTITKGLEPSGEPLDLIMPRWQMRDKDLNDLIDFLKTLNSEEHNEEVSLEKAKEIAQEYLSSLNLPDLMIGRMAEYSQCFVVKYQEKSTGRYAFDMFVDKRTGQIYPAMGPTMGWNSKYGPAIGMMGGIGMMRDIPGMHLDLDAAQKHAHDFLAQNNMPMTLNTDYQFLYYGFYEFLLTKDGRVIYPIAVNSDTGQVFYATWLGPIVNTIEPIAAVNPIAKKSAVWGSIKQK